MFFFYFFLKQATFWALKISLPTHPLVSDLDFCEALGPDSEFLGGPCR